MVRPSQKSLLKILRLQEELSIKEEVLSLAANADCKEEARGSPGRSRVSSSQVHDMSVDDRVLEAMVTAGPPLHITPSRRGPSASSTPAKENIGEELRSHTSPDLPSPFCEIGAESDPSGPKARLAQLQQGLAERMRRLVCDRGEGRTGQAMAKLNLVLADFEANMARYLIARIEATPNIELHPYTELVSLHGDPHTTGLEGVTWRHRRTKEEYDCPARNIFLFVGAEPETGWLAGCEVATDRNGFVLTGAAASGGFPARPAAPLESSVPGVFAVGDVRSGSVKRVGGAIGEGAAVVAQIHQRLAAANAASLSGA